MLPHFGVRRIDPFLCIPLIPAKFLSIDTIDFLKLRTKKRMEEIDLRRCTINQTERGEGEKRFGVFQFCIRGLVPFLEPIKWGPRCENPFFSGAKV